MASKDSNSILDELPSADEQPRAVADEGLPSAELPGAEEEKTPLFDFNARSHPHPAPIEPSIGPALAYLPNLIRTGGLQAVKNIAKVWGGEGGSMDKVVQALKGNAPPVSGQLEEMGVPHGVSNVADFVSGIAADPFLAAFPAKGEYAGPLAELADKAGLSRYRNALRKVDASYNKIKGATKETKTPFSDLAYEKGFLKSGMSLPEMEEAASEYRDNVLGPEYNKILENPAVQAKKSGVTEGVASAMPDFKEAAQYATDRPGAAKAANLILQDAVLGRKFFPGGRDPKELLALAKRYADTARGVTGLTGDVMNKMGNPTIYKKMLMSAAQAIRDRVQQVAEEALPGSKSKIQELNQQYNILKNASKPLAQQAMVESRKYPLTQVDAGLMGMATQEPIGLSIEGAKQLMRYHNSPSGGVRIGNFLRDYGTLPIWDMALRKAAINATPLTGEEQ